MSFYTALSSFLSGILCSMGFGGGAVLIIFLTVFLSYPQTKAQGINLLFYIPCAACSLLIYSRSKLVNKKKAATLALGGVIGIAAGYFLLDRIPTEYLSKLFGAFVVITGLKGLVTNKKSKGAD